jgi:hypothetical protein
MPNFMSVLLYMNTVDTSIKLKSLRENWANNRTVYVVIGVKTKLSYTRDIFTP